MENGQLRGITSQLEEELEKVCHSISSWGGLAAVRQPCLWPNPSTTTTTVLTGHFSNQLRVLVN